MATPRSPATLVELIEQAADVRPMAIALEARHHAPLSYQGLHALMQRVADELSGIGCGPAERVAVVMDHGPRLASVCLILAAVRTCVPLNPAYTEVELVDLMRRLGVGWVVVDEGQAAARAAAAASALPVVTVSAAPGSAGAFELSFDGSPPRPRGAAVSGEGAARPSAADTALVLHTSGSTARPKIVPLSHGNLLASAANVARSLELRPDDVCLSALPLFHIGALVDLLLAPLCVGGRIVIAPDMGAASFFAHLAEFAPTWHQAVPTMLQDSLRHAEIHGVETSRTSLRFIRSVSAPLPPPLLHAIEERFGVPVIEIYGMTETAGVITSNPMPPAERRAGSVGVPAGPEVVVRDGAGNAARPGQRGEIVVRGPSVMAGYESAPDVPGERMVDGWLRTGDEGYFDPDGYLYLTGRIKDIINRGGEKISPREIDEVALAHADVLDAAAFGVPHATLGEDVAMAVVPAPGRTVDVASVRAFCAARLARFKVPREIHVLAALPRAPGGKLQRGKLRDWCEGREATSNGDRSPPPSERQRVLVEAWREVLGVPAVGIRDDFVDLGGDSLRAVELAVLMSERLGREISTAALYDHPTVAELDAALDSFGPLAAREGVVDPVRAMLAEVRGLVATWEGRRHDDESLLVGWNTMGSRPPLFWGVQGFGELRAVAQRLGPDQPVWGMRSLYETRSKTVENVVALAGRYRDEIQRVQPDGPLRLGGYCAGGSVALEAARQLRGAGREVTSLSLFEHYQAEPYDGSVAFFFAAESGWHPFKTADAAWLAQWTGRVTLHPSRASHVDILEDAEAMEALSDELRRAHGRVAPTGPGPGLDVMLSATLPRTLVSRTRRTVGVQVTNRGTAPWPAGTTLFSRWGRPGSRRVLFDGATRLDVALEPGDARVVGLDVAAPLAPGPWVLSLQVVCGGDWNSGVVATPWSRTVVVLPGAAVWSYLRERLPGPADWPSAIRRQTGRTA